MTVYMIAPLLFPATGTAQENLDPDGAPVYGPRLAATSPLRVFAFNDLGIHCYDPDYSVLSILPLFNVVHAQVIQPGAQPSILDNTQVQVSYKAIADPTGSINKTSRRNKTNFWKYVQPLYGASLPLDVGLLGAKMPGPANNRQPMTYDAPNTWFTAEGIPISVFDDAMKKNPYSLMNVIALMNGRLGGSLPTVVPAANEMACGTCHLAGAPGATDPSIKWSHAPNPVIQKRLNILLLHDARMGTSLYQSRPVRCSSCHYDPAVDLAGTGRQTDQPLLSHAIHGFHADKIPQDATTTTTCFNCHPGSETQCLRGAMSQKGIVCIGCHGNMSSVGNESRSPWVDEPRCESCHTGDAMSHKGNAIILTQTYDGSASNAVFRTATNKRFAESPNTLYRNSFGHNGVACEACHGSTHAEWPSRETNDNLAAIQLQGHKGFIIECNVCHLSGLPRTTDGPHGMHNVFDRRWYDGGHENFYQSNPNGCKACHGPSLDGTVLSRTAVARTLNGQSIAAGTPIGCTLCHEKP